MRITKGPNYFYASLLGALLCLGGTSCALYKPGSTTRTLITECNVPTDQSGTISGRWQVTPIPIAFHSGDFQPDELAAMTSAAATWNTFFTASKTKNTLDFGSAENPRISNAANPTQAGNLCGQGLVQGGKTFVGNVVIYKSGRWPTNYPTSAIALTTFCTIPANPYPTMYMAAMEVNYQDFFVQGKKLPDLQSIILHELGHLLGLNHSCEAVTKKGTPNCNDPTLDATYYAASMFPVFSFDESGNGQQKKSLGANDESRANCLY